MYRDKRAPRFVERSLLAPLPTGSFVDDLLKIRYKMTHVAMVTCSAISTDCRQQAQQTVQRKPQGETTTIAANGTRAGSPMGCWKNSSGVPLALMAFGSYGRRRSKNTLRHAWEKRRNMRVRGVGLVESRLELRIKNARQIRNGLHSFCRHSLAIHPPKGKGLVSTVALQKAKRTES